MRKTRYRLPDWAWTGLTLQARIQAILTMGPLTREALVDLLDGYATESVVNVALVEMVARGRVVREDGR